MRVRVTVTLDVDPAAWAEEYGVERSEVRTDVQSWAASILAAQAADLGLLRRGTGLGDQGA